MPKVGRTTGVTQTGKPAVPGVDTKRNELIDAFKGFAIALVVIGHALQKQCASVEANFAFRLIYSFHMPLFMFLSGYTAYLGLRNNRLAILRDAVVKKLGNLIVPFFAWTLIVGYAFSGAFRNTRIGEYLDFTFVHANGSGLWFLWVLFLCFLALYAAVFAERFIGLFSYVVIVVLVELMPIHILDAGLFRLHVLFFMSGYFVSRNIGTFSKYATPLNYLSFVMFPVLFAFWQWTEPSFVQPLSGLIHHGMAIIIRGYKLATAFTGIGVAFFVVQRLQKSKLLTFLPFLGKRTLAIYVIHWSLYFGSGIDFKIGGIDNVFLTTIAVGLSASLAIMLSLAVTEYILKQNRILSFLFLGR